MENLLIAANCVLPTFIMLLVGVLLQNSQIVPEETYKHLSRICFSGLLPAMMFNNVYSVSIDTAFSPKLLTFWVVETIAVFLIAIVGFRQIIKDPRRRGVYLQCAYRSNVAVVGISFAQILMDVNGVAMMTMAIAVLVPLFNVLAVIALESCRGGKIALQKTLIGVLKNPLISAALIGILFRVCKITLPSAIRSSIDSIGKSASVMTLISLGASFHFKNLANNMRPLLLCTGLRIVLAPMVVVLAAIFCGFRGNALGVVLICAATPLATTSFPMAVACESDYELTGQAVVLSSALCCITMFLWVFILKQLGVM